MSDAVLWSIFVALFSGALFFAWPRSPRWDPVLFHHMVLATLLRGEVEGKDGKLEDWKGLLDAVLPRGPRPPSGGWTEEPTLLGSDYDLAQRLGADATWDGLAEAAPPVDAARTRRLLVMHEDNLTGGFGAEVVAHVSDHLEGDLTTRLALLEEARTLPFAAVWDQYCLEAGVPEAERWLAEVKAYERTVLSQRCA